MKKAPAAPAITTTPMIVKRYVPMPPVDGRELSFVSLIVAFVATISSADSAFSLPVVRAIVPDASLVLILYPLGAVTSLNL